MRKNDIKKEYSKYRSLIEKAVIRSKKTIIRSKRLTKQIAKPITYGEFKAIYLDDINPKTLARRIAKETIDTAKTRRILAFSLKQDGLPVDMREISKMSVREISANYTGYLKDKYHQLVASHGFEEGSRLYQLYYYGSD